MILQLGQKAGFWRRVIGAVVQHMADMADQLGRPRQRPGGPLE